LPFDVTQPDGTWGVLFVAVRGQGTTLISLQGGSSPQPEFPEKVQPEYPEFTYGSVLKDF